MSSLVQQLQREALDPRVDVATLLRMAKVVAHKLELSEFLSWIEKELNGYQPIDVIPTYREVTGEVKGWNPYNGWVPVLFDPKVQDVVSKRKTHQSVDEMTDLVENSHESKGSFMIPFDPIIEKRISEGFGFRTNVALFINRSSITGILSAVRNIVLDW